MRMVSWTGMMLAVFAGLVGCRTSEENIGKIDVALAARDPNGGVYRLRDATIKVQGASAEFTFHTEDDPERPVISAVAPVGPYALTLLDTGWRLEYTGLDGVPVDVVATLISPNPQLFDVYEAWSTSVKLRFLVDGAPIETGEGGFEVEIEVEQGGGAVDAGFPDGDPGSIDAAPIDGGGGDIDAAPADAAPIDGGPISCSDPLPCPTPAPGRLSVCGRIVDAETSFDPAFSGPVVVSVNDALAALGDPDSLPFATGAPDACNRFALLDVQVPSTGFMVVDIDDAAGAPDVLAKTVVAFAAQANVSHTDVIALSTRRTTDQAWSSSAGLVGPTFSDRGALLHIYLPSNDIGFPPVQNVRVTASAEVVPSQDYYFSDTSPFRRTTVAPGATATGPNGSALFLEGPLDNYGGIGGNCSFTSSLGASRPGLIFAQVHRASSCF